MAVSGSVSLELLHHVRPTTIVYHVPRFLSFLSKFLLKAKFITLVNLLADTLLFPEHVFTTGTVGREIADEILHWLDDRAAYENLRGQLEALKAQVAVPGACNRAAAAITQLVQSRPRQRAA